MITTKKTAIEYTQKEMRKTFKYFITKKSTENFQQWYGFYLLYGSCKVCIISGYYKACIISGIISFS